jgi:hypothetical protein
VSAGVLPEVPLLLERPPVDWERHRGDKRPKILPPPGEVWRNPSTGRKVGHRYYTRVTTYADAITEAYNLTAWKLRRLALGLGQRADYVRLAAAYTSSEHDRDALDELVGKALEAAGPNSADLGTALHALTERLDRGDDLGTPPDEVLPDLAAYTALTQGLIAYRHREARVVCDQLETAGTPDGHAHIAEPCPAGCGPEVLHIIDTKTGSIRYPGKMSTQLAIYSRSDLYEPATGERTPIEVCQSWGAIIHLPVESGECAPFWLDLEHGWRGAELCGPVREWHKVKADDILRPFASVQPVKVIVSDVIEGEPIMEVTRIEPRLASTNIKAPPAPGLGDVTELLAESLAAVAGAVDLETPAERDDAGDEAALHEDLEPSVAEVVHRAIVGDEADRPAPEPCDVRVVNAEHPDEPAEHWCATHDSGWPHDEPEPRVPEDVVDVTTASGKVDPLGPYPVSLAQAMQPDGRVLKETRRPGIPLPPGPDTCAHSGGRTMIPGRGLCCRDCGEPAGFGPQPATPERCETTELRVDECACPKHRPDLVNVDDSGVEPDDGPTEWPGVDDVPIEQLASGPDSDAEDEPEVDQLADEIARCVTVRDLELLSSKRWREWQQPHRDLAVERHDQLERAERAAKPVAAFEAAVAAASTRAELLEVMNAAQGAAWLTAELEALAGARWAELRVPA